MWTFTGTSPQGCRTSFLPHLRPGPQPAAEGLRTAPTAGQAPSRPEGSQSPQPGRGTDGAQAGTPCAAAGVYLLPARHRLLSVPIGSATLWPQCWPGERSTPTDSPQRLSLDGCLRLLATLLQWEGMVRRRRANRKAVLVAASLRRWGGLWGGGCAAIVGRVWAVWWVSGAPGAGGLAAGSGSAWEEPWLPELGGGIRCGLLPQRGKGGSARRGPVLPGAVKCLGAAGRAVWGPVAGGSW